MVQRAGAGSRNGHNGDGLTESQGNIYVDTPWVSVRWDIDHGCVIVEWKAFATHEEFQGALTKALEVIRERGASCLVNDARHLESMNAEDQWWIRSSWAPQAIKAGVMRIAVVVAEQVPVGFTRMVPTREVERMQRTHTNGP